MLARVSRVESRQLSANNFENKKILVITSFLVRYKNEETPQNFSKETTLATTIDTMRYIFCGI